MGTSAGPYQSRRAASVVFALGKLAKYRLRHLGLHPGGEDGLSLPEQDANDPDDLLRRLAWPEHHLGKALAEGAVGIDAGVGCIDEGQAHQLLEGALGVYLALPYGEQKRTQPISVHAFDIIRCQDRLEGRPLLRMVVESGTKTRRLWKSLWRSEISVSIRNAG